MKLDEDNFKSFQVGKTFERDRRINFLDFSYDGLRCITSGEDDQMVIYSCEAGVEKQVVRSLKYGCDLVHFTHASNTIVYASNKEGKDHAIRYMSLHDNKYLRYFGGHTAKVVSLSVSPVDDSLISGSLDRSVRLWDLRLPDPVGVMQCQGRPIASFDPEGLIFSVGVQSEMIKLYDVRSFDKGPFSTFKYRIETGCDWTGIKFSLDGKLMMLTTNGTVIRVIDAYEGKPLFTLAGYQNNKGLPIEASFTPDSQFVVSGSTDGRLHVWRTENGAKVGVLNGNHANAVTNVQFNPKYALMASACHSLSFWVPGGGGGMEAAAPGPSGYVPSPLPPSQHLMQPLSNYGGERHYMQHHMQTPKQQGYAPQSSGSSGSGGYTPGGVY